MFGFKFVINTQMSTLYELNVINNKVKVRQLWDHTFAIAFARIWLTMVDGCRHWQTSKYEKKESNNQSGKQQSSGQTSKRSFGLPLGKVP